MKKFIFLCLAGLGLVSCKQPHQHVSQKDFCFALGSTICTLASQCDSAPKLPDCMEHVTNVCSEPFPENLLEKQQVDACINKIKSFDCQGYRIMVFQSTSAPVECQL
jgi:hypothetical protein